MTHGITVGRARRTKDPPANVAGVTPERIPLSTGDGLEIVATRYRRKASDRVVLLVHGLTASSAMFTMPEHYNLVSALLDAGYSDVWCLDWRGSGDLEHNTSGRAYTLDDVALYDLPACVGEIRRRAPGARLHIVAHCIGALTVSMAACAGLLGELQSLTCSPVFLVPRLSPLSKAKLLISPELIQRALEQTHVPTTLDAAGLLSRAGALHGLVALAPSECRNPSCRIHNFMWGIGASPLFEHRNLSPITHGRLGELLGDVPLCYYDHIRQMVVAGQAIRSAGSDCRYDGLPQNYLASVETIGAPILLIAGEKTGVWGDSNRVAFELLRSEHPRVDVSLREIPGYAHLDMFIGQHAAFEVFPHIIGFLDASDLQAEDPWRFEAATDAVAQ